jgi:hypothetical protein
MKKYLLTLGLLCISFIVPVHAQTKISSNTKISSATTLQIASNAVLGLVQFSTTFSGGGPYTIAYTATNNTLGNTSCININYIASTGTATIGSITSSAGNTYVSESIESQASTSYANIYVQQLCAFNITGGVEDSLSIPFTCSVTCTPAGMFLVEIGPGGVFDQSSQGLGTTSATINAGSLTPPSNGAFALMTALMDDGAGFGSCTVGIGWTIGQQNAGGAQENCSQYLTQMTAGSIAGTLTAPRSPNHWVSSMITIRTH